MHGNDPHEQYSFPSPERYSRDKGKPPLPDDANLRDDTSLPVVAQSSAPPLTPLSASLQRAAGTSPRMADAAPTGIKRPSLRWQPKPIYGVIGIGLLVALVATMVFLVHTTSHATPASPPTPNTAFSATQTREAAQLTIAKTSIAATNVANFNAPHQPFTAQVPGPCGDSLHWGTEDVGKPLCLADGVQLTASTDGKVQTQFAPIIVFGFPGGDFMDHYQVSLTFAFPTAVNATPLTCGEFQLQRDERTDSDISVCQDGSWIVQGSGLDLTNGQCVADPSHSMPRNSKLFRRFASSAG